MQVFLEVDMMPPLDALNDALQQASVVSAHPAQYQLLKRGLYPGARRYRRNWKALYDFHYGVFHMLRSMNLQSSKH